MGSILITVDALRADHLAQYGYERDTMPVLDRLLQDGTLFKQAFSNAPYTRVSVPSFQTSRYLAYEQLHDLPTIGSILNERGIQTAIIGTQTGIDLVEGKFRYGETVDLGRDEFHERANTTRPLWERISRQVDRGAEIIGSKLRKYGSEALVSGIRKPYKAVFSTGGFEYQGYTEASIVTNRAVEWLEKNSSDDFFLWVHYMEAHRPFGVHDDDPEYLNDPLPEGEIKELLKKVNLEPEAVTEEEHETLINLYDSDVRYCSQHLSRLFDYLYEANLYETTNILFSSDHGEEFGEHGHYGHRNYPYEELVHVPLIVKKDDEQPERVTGQRELVDLLPTICNLHETGTEMSDFVGEDLFKGGSRDVLLLGQPKNRPSAVSIRKNGWKYIHAPDEPILYNLDVDPSESENIVEEHPQVVSDFRDLVPEHLIRRDPKQLRDPEDAVDKKQLAALGYVESDES